MGSIWLGAFVGFLVMVVLAFLFPGIGSLIGLFIGGLVAGLVARGIFKGLIAGFLAGIFGGIIIAILAILDRTCNCRSGLSGRNLQRGIIWQAVAGLANRRSCDISSELIFAGIIWPVRVGFIWLEQSADD